MAEADLGQMIGPAVVLMAAAVVSVPLFRRGGLGPVLGYFAAGLLVGPSVLSLITDAQSIFCFSALGVVIFLFVIGLELRLQKLWAMRGQIFGLGFVQVAGATVFDGNFLYYPSRRQNLPTFKVIVDASKARGSKPARLAHAHLEGF